MWYTINHFGGCNIANNTRYMNFCPHRYDTRYNFKLLGIYLNTARGNLRNIYGISPKISQKENNSFSSADCHKTKTDLLWVYSIAIFLFLIKVTTLVRRNHAMLLIYIGALKILIRNQSLQETPILHSLKLCPNNSFLSIEIMNKMNELHSNDLNSFYIMIALANMKFKNNAMFYKYIILLSGDISLNPGPDQVDTLGIWHPFKKRGLHFLHLNVNSLLPKIDELRHICKLTNAAIIGITETKLDDSILNCEINIDGYDLLRCDRDRHGGGVACYIRQSINYNVKSIFPVSIENIVIDVLLPKTKPFTVCTLYRPPSQYNFINDINDNFSKLCPESTDIFILGDINTNLFINGSNIFNKKISLQNSSTYNKPHLNFD